MQQKTLVSLSTLAYPLEGVQIPDSIENLPASHLYLALASAFPAAFSSPPAKGLSILMLSVVCS